MSPILRRLTVMRLSAPIGILLLLFIAAPLRGDDANHQLLQLQHAIPAGVEDCTAANLAEIEQAVEWFDQWMAARTWVAEPLGPAASLKDLRESLELERNINHGRERLFALRTEFAGRPDDDVERERLRVYLRACTALIDLSGRLRYLLRDRIERATYEVEADPRQLAALVELLIEYRSGIGASIVTYLLFDPASDEEGEPAPRGLKQRVLELVAVTGQLQLLPELAALLEEPEVPASLLIQLGETLERIGLPQSPRPGSEAKSVLSAEKLCARLAAIEESALAPGEIERRKRLLAWLEDRIAHGVRGDTFRIAGFDLRAGDWLLMRNPSPYNRFTDVSPGLFTHVGVVVAETASDGIRRFEIVDLPERGNRIPAIDCHTYLQETLHFVFLRHPDEKVQLKLASTAASMIGNETQFDLTFRTERVEEYRGQPLEGKRIHTYCAGFLLICAQEAATREEFFPIPERRAGGNCPENLATMGLEIGDHIISPTGALFSPNLELVASCEPMYDPGREIRESIYDFFAEAMIERRLRPSPTTAQALRQKIASLAEGSSWIQQALASFNNVSPHMDLVSAAKAAAVIETLDEISRYHGIYFERARHAVLAESHEALRESSIDEADYRDFAMLRARHEDLVARIAKGKLTPRDLRVELVAYYSRAGHWQLVERFFPEEEAPGSDAPAPPPLPPQ